MWRGESLADDEELDDRISRFQSLSISFIFSNREPTKRKIPSEIKEKLKSAAGEKCPLCPNTMISSSIKKTPLHERESTPDHILDLGLGGNNTEENFLILCHKCNWAKNHAMQRHLTIPGMAGGTPGHKPWRVAFRRKGSNIAKLMEYVEWSFRIEEPSCEHRFPELHGYFMQDRFGKSEEPISTSSKRLEKPENTLWRRFARFIYGLFKRKTNYTAEQILLECIESGGTTPVKLGQKLTEHQTIHGWDKTGKGAFNERYGISKQQTYTTTITKILGGRVRVTGSGNDARYSIAPVDSESPSEDITEIPEINFTPEDFSKALLGQKERVSTTNFSSLYGSLIKENETFNLKQYGIKPNDYLIDKCSNLLTIIERPDGNIPPTVHYWIDGEVIS